ncbi:helix-turn-helix transcriptional regulator [Amycolatopsis stemonae]
MHSKDAQMLVLTALAEGPLHGYAINGVIEGLTGARLGAGSLYGALTRLEARKLVEPAGDQPDERQKQRTLRITADGRAVLRAELEQMTRVAQAGLRALGSAPA